MSLFTNWHLSSLYQNYRANVRTIYDYKRFQDHRVLHAQRKALKKATSWTQRADIQRDAADQLRANRIAAWQHVTKASQAYWAAQRKLLQGETR